MIVILIILLAFWLVSGKGMQVTGYKDGKPYALTVYPVGNGQYATAECAAAFQALQAKRMAENKPPLVCNSGFRTMEQQIAERAAKGSGAATPGYSEHQQGLALDISTVDARGVSGYSSETYYWIANNAPAFGFYESVDGEPWHWSYWGRAAT